MTQPRPSGNGVGVTDRVVADMLARREYGIGHYGVELKTSNGRNALLDAYEESLDMTVYLKQLLMEAAYTHWVDVNTRLPDKEGYYLTWIPDSAYQFRSSFWDNKEWTSGGIVSHWCEVKQPNSL